jgi:hypothetical protein
VAERVWVRDITNEEGNWLLRIVRPWRQMVNSRSGSTRASSSRVSRLLPMPGAPTRTTSRGPGWPAAPAPATPGPGRPCPWPGPAPPAGSRSGVGSPGRSPRRPGCRPPARPPATGPRQGRPDRPLRVVPVGRRGPEQGHHGVADELLHRPPVALQLGSEAGVVGAQHPPDVLDVQPLGPGGEADQVAEQHAHELALVAPRQGRAQGGPAGQAEPGPGRVALTATPADRHGRRIATPTALNRRRPGAPEVRR